MADLFHCLPDQVRFTHFCTVLDGILQSNGNGQYAISSTFVGPFVADKIVKFRYPGLSYSREISPEAVEGGIFDRSLLAYIRYGCL